LRYQSRKLVCRHPLPIAVRKAGAQDCRNTGTHDGIPYGRQEQRTARKLSRSHSIGRDDRQAIGLACMKARMTAQLTERMTAQLTERMTASPTDGIVSRLPDSVQG